MLVGGTYGLFAGSLFDIYDADESETALGQISDSVKPGHPALLACDRRADAGRRGRRDDRPRRDRAPPLGGRGRGRRSPRPRCRAQGQVEARKELDRSRRDRNKAAVDAKLDAMKAKLHHGQPAGSAS
jgi:hypothetical protein